MSIYDYSVPTPKNGDFSLKEYEGKVIMIVNTATGCGFTPWTSPAISSPARRPVQMTKFMSSVLSTSTQCSRR